jgi:hypothetical protein
MKWARRSGVSGDGLGPRLKGGFGAAFIFLEDESRPGRLGPRLARISLCRCGQYRPEAAEILVAFFDEEPLERVQIFDAYFEVENDPQIFSQCRISINAKPFAPGIVFVIEGRRAAGRCGW